MSLREKVIEQVKISVKERNEIVEKQRLEAEKLRKGILSDAQRVINLIPAAIHGAILAGEQTCFIYKCLDTLDYEYADRSKLTKQSGMRISETAQYLKGVARIVYDECSNADLQPFISYVHNDKGDDFSDSWFEIHITIPVSFNKGA